MAYNADTHGLDVQSVIISFPKVKFNPNSTVEMQQQQHQIVNKGKSFTYRLNITFASM
jgi:hypothetical protein